MKIEDGLVIDASPEDIVDGVLRFPDEAKRIHPVFFKGINSITIAGKGREVKTVDFNNVEYLSKAYVTWGIGIFSHIFPNACVVIAPKLKIVPCAFFEGFSGADAENKLTKVVLSEAETVGEKAFYCARALNSVYLPKVKSIGLEAFRYCYNLKTLDVCSSITIEAMAFANSGVEWIDCGTATVDRNVFGSGLKTLRINNISQLHKLSVYDCNSLEAIILKEAVNGKRKKFPYTFSGKAYRIVVGDEQFECYSNHSEDACAYKVSQSFEIGDKKFAQVYCLDTGGYFAKTDTALSHKLLTEEEMFKWLKSQGVI